MKTPGGDGLAELLLALGVDPSRDDAVAAGVAVARGLRADGRALLEAFHDATRRPLGVTPASGERFYDHRMAEAAEARRPRVGTAAEVAERPKALRDAAREEAAELTRRLRRVRSTLAPLRGALSRSAGATGATVPTSLLAAALAAVDEDARAPTGVRR